MGQVERSRHAILSIGTQQLPCILADCKVEEWTAWSGCNVTCGGGINRRSRAVVQEPKNGGAECPVLEETTVCNPVECAVPCKFGEWTDWGECNVDCGDRTKTRTRPVLQKPKFGGVACLPLEETMVCTAAPCVTVSLRVKSAITLEVLPDVSINFTLGALLQRGTTDDQGVASFTLSPSMAALGPSATIDMSKE